MDAYMNIIFRTLIMYFIILVVFRLMGKREIGELSILDLVVFIMMGELAVVSIENGNKPLWNALLPILLLMFIQIALAYLSLKSKKIRNVIDGQPLIIINKGKIDESAMKKQRYNLDDLLVQLREKDIFNIADVEFAILETTGKLSVIEKNKTNEKKTFPFPLILDGTIQLESLAEINKDPIWLRRQLRERGFDNYKQISYCSFENGVFFIDEK